MLVVSVNLGDTKFSALRLHDVHFADARRTTRVEQHDVVVDCWNSSMQDLHDHSPCWAVAELGVERDRRDSSNTAEAIVQGRTDSFQFIPLVLRDFVHARRKYETVARLSPV